MSYMEQQMQSQIDGAIALQAEICDEACDVYKEKGLTPRQLAEQSAELLAALKKTHAELKRTKEEIGCFIFTVNDVLSFAEEVIAKAEARS